MKMTMGQYFSRWKGILISAIVLFYLLGPPVHAQNPFGIATNVPIDNPRVQDGFIIVAKNNDFTLSNEAYQPEMIGVVNQQSAIEIRFKNQSNTYPVVTSGQAYMVVSLSNGEIRKGDYITSSPIEGVGMKATVPGQVIGIALEGMTAPNEDKIGKLRVAIQSDYFMNPLFQVGPQSSVKVNLNKLFAPQNEQMLIRYLIGGGIFLVSLMFCLFYFGRLSLKGVEALGRNPLAATKIQVGIVLNVIMGIAICFVAFGAALYIIRYM
jgi:F0F1-type ATP synthase membrane subunit c/vacuolar-type H+-ATPase subunit K